MEKQKLIETGFTPKIYDGQEGEFLSKKMKLKQLPDEARARILSDLDLSLFDGDDLGDLDFIADITPGNQIQLVLVSDDEYWEGPYSLDSEEGKQLLQEVL